MVDARQQFGTRVKSLESKNVKLARGYYTTIRADGLVVARPARRGLRLPTKLLVALVALFVCFKGFVLATIGPTAYDSRLDSLAQGTVIEQAGAWVLQVDPVTQTLARKLGPVFRG